MNSVFSQAVGSQSEYWASPFDDLVNQEGRIIGTPEQDARTFPGQQSYDDTCAIRCQEFIIEQFTGSDIDESALVQQAMDYGWYEPGGGTKIEDVGNLLEVHGIPVNRYEDATMFDLVNELAQGHKVIIGVDSGELWYPIQEALEDDLGIEAADHAVVVSGIDTTDPDNIHIIISDPGTGEAVASYPMEQFVDAWEDSDFFMVTTQEPAPSWVPEMVNFDYDLGHIEEVAGIPYEDFVALQDQPDMWEQLFDNWNSNENMIEEPSLTASLFNEPILSDEAYTTSEMDLDQDASDSFDDWFE